MRAISSNIYLSANLSEEQKTNCLKRFVSKDFLAYDYDREIYVYAEIVLTEEYLEYK